jgi:hypothetical protein
VIFPGKVRIWVTRISTNAPGGRMEMGAEAN